MNQIDKNRINESENIERNLDNEEDTNKKNKRGRKVRTLAIRVFYLVFSLYLLIWLTSPVIARYFMADFITSNYGIILSDQSSLRYNPFTSHLSVRDLTLQKDEKVVLQLNKLDLEIRLHRLLFKQFYVSEIKASGLFVLVKQTDKSVELAGFEINALPLDEKQTNKLDDSVTVVTKDESSDFEVIIPNFEFVNGEFSLLSNSNKHLLKIEGFNITDIFLSSMQQLAAIHIQADIDNAKVNLNIDVALTEMLGDINVDISISDYDLKNIAALLPETIQSLDGQIGFSSNQVISFQKEQISLQSPETEITLNNFAFQNKETIMSQQHQSILFSDLELALYKQEQKKELKIAQLKLNGLNTLTELNDMKILNKGQRVSVNEVDMMLDSSGLINSNIDEFSIEVDNVKGTNNGIEFDSRGVALLLANIDFTPEKLEVSSVTLEGLNGILRLLPSGSKVAKNINPANSELVKNENKSNPLTDKDNLEVSSNQPVIKIDKILLSNTEEIVFIDESVTPVYKREILIEEMNLEKINSGKPLQESPFIIKGNSDQYTQFEFTGFVKPFTEKVNLAIHGKLNEVSLPPASSYVRDVMGFQFESGELDTALDLIIKDSEIEGATDIKIRGLGMETVENYDQNNLQQQVAMPLNMALGMLKDDDDNLELNIPMQGNLDNPSFGFGSFVNLITKKAIQSAATSYLLNAFVPYAELLNITISAGDFIMKTRFEDLIYQSEQTDISEGQHTYLNQFIALMKEKKSTSVKVCAVSTIDDLGSQREELATEKDKAAYLMEISNKRMSAFKQYVVSKSIESSRILLCSPKVDLSKESKPRIEISV